MEPRKKVVSWIPILLYVVGAYALIKIIFSSLNTSPVIGYAVVPKEHADNKIHIHDMNKLTTSGDALANQEKILLLTPLARFYEEYWENLLKLTYPHELIELGFIVPNTKTGDEALEKLNEAIKSTQSGKYPFGRVTVLRQDTSSQESQDEADRHKLSVQKQRRSDMALARNSLLFTTLQSDTSWILWLDSDIVETPPTIIQDMTSHNRDVLVANTYQRYKEGGEMKIRAYDFNNWIDSEIAQNMAREMGQDEILLEGYSEMATYRTLMAHLYDSTGDVNTIIELDGVGGTALLVRSDVHRDGAMFPPFAFYHLIETEAFAKMARRLNYGVYGLPNYLVYHYNE